MGGPLPPIAGGGGLKKGGAHPDKPPPGPGPGLGRYMGRVRGGGVLVARAPTMPGRPALEMEISTESGGQIAFSSEIFNFLCSEKLCPLSRGTEKFRPSGSKNRFFQNISKLMGNQRDGEIKEVTHIYT